MSSLESPQPVGPDEMRAALFALNNSAVVDTESFLDIEGALDKTAAVIGVQLAVAATRRAIALYNMLGENGDLLALCVAEDGTFFEQTLKVAGEIEVLTEEADEVAQEYFDPMAFRSRMTS